MPTIHIVLDSTAHASPEMLVAHPNLHIVPLTVMLGDTVWKEPELSSAELFRLVKEKGIHPRTSQPAPGEFAKVFAPAAEGNPIIMIGVSGGLSGTVNGARAAAREFKGREIYVVDSCTAAIGTVKLAEAALNMAAAGQAASVIAERLQQMADATQTLILPDSLEYLHKGGRIGGAAALFGSILQIKPILKLQDGKIQVFDKVRTKPRAVARMLEELDKHGELAYIGVAHGEAPVVAGEIYATVCQRYPNIPVSLTGIGSALSAHLGPGVIGLFFQTKC
ncbi:DegV family protein [Sporomusa malonica]|uniref:EDD domain protein, DegV family n=1 Tax=Sporomusa malonica TaxID=112901 RepID=A0A1W2ELA2_9FIRM|nr:DegV family protein [Sporomusa malonica]SMD10499.1 EDD domain protein, DegV family [Sporomusa malonica]